MRKLVLNHTEGVNLLSLYINYKIGEDTESCIVRKEAWCSAEKGGWEGLKGIMRAEVKGDGEDLQGCMEEILKTHLPIVTHAKVRTVDTSSFQLRKAGIWASTPFV